MAKALDANDDLLDRLEDHPLDRRLRTTRLEDDTPGGLLRHPVRYDDWYVVWERCEKPGTIWIIDVTRLDA
jgi:hypothetical protein